MTRMRKAIELIHEGNYATEVEVELLYSDDSWSPTMSLKDARKLETARLALQRGDVTDAAKHDGLFELIPAAAE